MTGSNCGPELKKLSGEIDVLVAVPPFNPKHRDIPFHLNGQNEEAERYLRWVKRWLTACAEALKEGGLLYVYGLPQWLPHFVEPLDGLLTFKYWIVVQTEVVGYSGLKPQHTGLALYVKGSNGFAINKVRFPHPTCQACGRTLKDYGGKSHLMHDEGCALSDVWRDLTVDGNEVNLPGLVRKRILQLSLTEGRRNVVIVAPRRARGVPRLAVTEPTHSARTNSCPPQLVDCVHCADAVEFMRKLPDNCIDLVFADPPYNLAKDYTGYTDRQIDDDYLRWCETWLAEYARILKPGGSLFVLNLPKWAIHHARFLSRWLYFQRWIVWDALSEPRGKLMPAHYALLYFTKGPTAATFNYRWFETPPTDWNGFVLSPDAPIYCLRQSCLRARKAAGDDRKVPLSDIWFDIHRIKHKRDRDAHPCQLPDKLMERIIQLSTNEGDVVLDCFGGAGTTAVIAKRLNRRFVLTEIDQNYVDMTNRKLKQLEKFGELKKTPTRKARPTVTKKELQLELQQLTLRLGRLPTKWDVEKHSHYALVDFERLFPSWGKALKAAKLVDLSQSQNGK